MQTTINLAIASSGVDRTPRWLQLRTFLLATAGAIGEGADNKDILEKLEFAKQQARDCVIGIWVGPPAIRLRLDISNLIRGLVEGSLPLPEVALELEKLAGRPAEDDRTQ